ncbi:hypothetical protein MPER_08922, partial [Moniliophthora perniciosa FA553]
MSQKVKILVTGVTGYIGGAVVNFLARPDVSSFDIRAIVRSKEKKLRNFGITSIIGSHNDENVMVKAASEVDIVIAMSSTGELTDNADQIETLPPTQVHRNVDLEIVSADKEGYVKTYIILPSTIYSIAQGPLFAAGISNPHSIQIPAIIKASIDRKRAGMVGAGKNLWPNVDIHELADLYSLLYDAILDN